MNVPSSCSLRKYTVSFQQHFHIWMILARQCSAQEERREIKVLSDVVVTDSFLGPPDPAEYQSAFPSSTTIIGFFKGFLYVLCVFCVTTKKRIQIIMQPPL